MLPHGKVAMGLTYTSDSPTLAPYINFYLYARLETGILKTNGNSRKSTKVMTSDECNEKINPAKNVSYAAHIKEAL